MIMGMTLTASAKETKNIAETKHAVNSFNVYDNGKIIASFDQVTDWLYNINATQNTNHYAYAVNMSPGFSIGKITYSFSGNIYDTLTAIATINLINPNGQTRTVTLRTSCLKGLISFNNA